MEVASKPIQWMERKERPQADTEGRGREFRTGDAPEVLVLPVLLQQRRAVNDAAVL